MQAEQQATDLQISDSKRQLPWAQTKSREGMGPGLSGLGRWPGATAGIEKPGEGPSGLPKSLLCTRALSPAAPWQVLMCSSRPLVTQCIVKRWPLWLHPHILQMRALRQREVQPCAEWRAHSPCLDPWVTVWPAYGSQGGTWGSHLKEASLSGLCRCRVRPSLSLLEPVLHHPAIEASFSLHAPKVMRGSGGTEGPCLRDPCSSSASHSGQAA